MIPHIHVDGTTQIPDKELRSLPLRIRMNLIFPCTLILLDFAAAAVYLAESDWRRTVYWIAAAVLTAAVTF